MIKYKIHCDLTEKDTFLVSVERDDGHIEYSLRTHEEEVYKHEVERCSKLYNTIPLIEKGGFAIMHMEGSEECFSWWNEENGIRIPSISDSKLQCQREIVQDKIDHLEEFMNGDRAFDEIDSEIDEWVEEVIVTDTEILNKERKVLWKKDI